MDERKEYKLSHAEILENVAWLIAAMDDPKDGLAVNAGGEDVTDARAIVKANLEREGFLKGYPNTDDGSGGRRYALEAEHLKPHIVKQQRLAKRRGPRSKPNFSDNVTPGELCVDVRPTEIPAPVRNNPFDEM